MMFSRNNRSVSRVEIHTGPTFNHGRVLRNKLSDSDFIEPNIPKFTAVVPAISWVFTLVKTAKSLKHCFPSRESANFSSTPHITRDGSGTGSNFVQGLRDYGPDGHEDIHLRRRRHASGLHEMLKKHGYLCCGLISAVSKILCQ
uniref:Uncharacterized protein n=1 Tax=Rhodosorus marinus TaxID=101924 RepID=A0A7S0BFW0_9RHOD